MRKRMIAAVLTLTLLAILLPTAALADAVSPDPNEAGDTIDYIKPRDTLQDNNGTVTRNQGTVTNNNEGGTINDNAVYGVVVNNNGTVNNSRGENQLYGVVTNNYGVVHNNGGWVGTNSGIVFNSLLGVVDWNVSGTVYNHGGSVQRSTGDIYNYGGGGVPGNGNYTLYQYWKVSFKGTAVDHITPTGLTSEFSEKWVLENDAIILTPKSGFYFSTAPTATVGRVTKDGETYRIEAVNRNTEITVDGVSTATPVIFSRLIANGGDTETTSLLTLNFDQDIGGLTAADLTVTGATKGALAKVEGETGVIRLAYRISP